MRIDQKQLAGLIAALLEAEIDGPPLVAITDNTTGQAVGLLHLEPEHGKEGA